MPAADAAAPAGPEALPPATPSAQEIRDAAREILARPEFQEPPKSLYQQLQEEVAEWLGELVGTLVGGGPPGFVAWLVLVAALGAAGYLVLRGLQSDRRRRGRSSEESVVERRRPPADWEAEAAAFEARGEWRPALRCRYRALIARLARKGVVDEVAGRTAGEYRAAVTEIAPAAAPDFSGATDLFERAWYGNAATGADESTAFRDLADRVLERVER
ncbi:MAG: DUF4129 domain-containing protein [Actinobacteria bacterium]|nr:DUF4129 domain-containing protein [Actinomycetota bacterium]MBW3649883.1 DUF4129 domain-containing protein [Actinomycetota bacterium]